jgi:hypothetical protein
VLVVHALLVARQAADGIRELDVGRLDHLLLKKKETEERVRDAGERK